MFVLEGNGLPWKHIQPEGMERKNVVGGSYTKRRGNGDNPFRDLPLADYELAPALQPVNDFKDRVTIRQGLSGKMNGDGTMLGNTLIVYFSDAAEGHHSRCWEWPRRCWQSTISSSRPTQAGGRRSLVRAVSRSGPPAT